MLVAAACTTTNSPATSPTPAPELSREDAITWARGIDPCALIGRDKLEALGTIEVVGTSSGSTSCEAHIDNGTEKGISVSWATAIVPKDFHAPGPGTVETVDGIEVRQIDTASSVPEDIRKQLVESRCSYDIAFENGIAVRMWVSTDRDRDACAIGLPLVRAVIAAWPEPPAQGSSPDTTITALTAAVPCAVVPELQKSHTVTLDWNEQSLTSCFFTIDGANVLAGFDYRATELLGVEGQPETFGGRAGFSTQDPSGETFARVAVGDEFDGVWAGKKARLVPVFEVNGDNHALVVDVVTAMLGQLPG